MQHLCFLVLFALAAIHGGDGACDSDEADKCLLSRDYMDAANDILTESAKGGSADFSKFCRVFQTMLDCAGKHLGGCDNDAKKLYEIIVTTYNTDPYKCGLKLTAAAAGFGPMLVVSLLIPLVAKFI